MPNCRHVYSMERCIFRQLQDVGCVCVWGGGEGVRVGGGAK